MGCHMFASKHIMYISSRDRFRLVRVTQRYYRQVLGLAMSLSEIYIDMPVQANKVAAFLNS